MTSTLITKLQKKNAVIGVVGLGYVGLPLLKNILAHGFAACGFDIDQSKLDALSAGEPYISHIEVADVQAAVTEKRATLSADFSAASDCDVLIMCVPTPLNKHREPDLGFVTSSLEGLLPYLHSSQAVVLESTTYPGTTEEELLPRIEATGLTVGEDIFLIYSPEREDPGNRDFSFTQIPKVVGGMTAACGDVGEALYQSIGSSTVRVSSAKAAEMSKILENTYRSVNIALVNELKVLAHAMDVDIFEVIDAAATKPFGFQAFYPGPGLGGHCIPIDPFYLTWKAREYGFHTRFIELAGEVNTAMPQYVIDRTIEGLNNAGKALRGARVLVLGVAYKKNVGDVRESPGVHIIDKLLKLGADVSYHDPHVARLPKMRDYQLQMSHLPLDEGDIAKFDCCIIATDHDAFDYASLGEAQLVIDARGRLEQDANINLIRA